MAPTSIQIPPPSRAIQLRASFDTDPSVYVGRFVPDGASPSEIDENAGMVTRCSKFVHPKVVDSHQEMEETMYVSHKVAVSLGIPVAGVSASRDNGDTVRVRYTITRKVQSDIDADGLVACCRAEPSQCTGKIIGEFLMGSGDILQTRDDSESLGGHATTPQQIQAGGTFASSSGAKKLSSFKDVYFAFLTTATPVAGGVQASDSADCSWCDKVPGSLDGTYFCGLSGDASSEAEARDQAMRNAREQVVKFLSESITVASVSQILDRALSDTSVVKTASSGIASHVKDQRWCKAEHVASPDGEKVRTKVLAFLPKEDAQSARSAVAEAAIAQQKASSGITPEQERAVREAAKGAGK
jgi:hypothetical protein